MEVVETQFKERAYDGKWERIVKIVDYENAYTFETESGTKVRIVPEKWITVGVYDYLFDEVPA